MIDLSVVPPATVLEDADDFTSFKIVVREASTHAWVRWSPSIGLRVTVPATRNGDGDWENARVRRQHGWVDDTAVRAHVEWAG